ncbi:MAG: Ig-like domain-containing protein, partial [Leucothrix sp.]
PGRPAIPAQAGRAGRPAQPARAGSPGRPATPAIPAIPATPARFVWKTEVIPSAPIWIQRAIRNTISHNKSISTYTTRRVSKAVDDIITITSREETSINVLANDDPGLRLLSASEPKDGTVRIINDRIIYTPNATFTGSDTFTYTVIDSNNRQTTSRVTVNVSQATNSAPIAMDDNVTTKFENPVTINVTANDRDIDGDISCISNIARQPSEGSVTIASNGLDIIYTPNSGFIGTDTFEYTVCDEKGAIDSATVTVTTTSLGLNAMDDSDSTDYETAVTIHVAENDVNLDGGYTCVLSIPDEPDNGFVVISNNGQDIVYTPNNNFIGSDSFTYTACDSEGDRDDATVTVAVRAP